MSKPTEIKIGKLHYKLEESNGFWTAQFQTDPMSATITDGELIYLVQDAIDGGNTLIAKIANRISELEQFVKDLKDG